MLRAIVLAAALATSVPAMAQDRATPPINRSLTLSGSSQALFGDVGARGIVERWVYNSSAANALAINIYGGTAALNGAGSINLAAGQSWIGRVSGPITVIGTAGQPVTAGER